MAIKQTDFLPTEIKFLSKKYNIISSVKDEKQHIYIVNSFLNEIMIKLLWRQTCTAHDKYAGLKTFDSKKKKKTLPGVSN